MTILTLNDGRSELWQWDTGRTLAVDADCSQVHFSNKVFGRSIDVDVVDGTAIIPDILLQTDKELSVWAFVGTAENGYTKISKTFKVNRRNKPADYVFTPADQMTLQTIQSQIGDLADLTTEAKDTLVAAINEAARAGGGDGIMDLRVADGYVQYSTDGGMTWANLIAMAELKGADGITPTIGSNGNWYLGDTDTGKPSRGETGPAGADGKDGATGAAGADGHTPVKGTDYWTAEDQQSIVADVLAALPGGGEVSGETWELLGDVTLGENASSVIFSDIGLETYKKFAYEFSANVDSGTQVFVNVNGANATAYAVGNIPYANAGYRRMRGEINQNLQGYTLGWFATYSSTSDNGDLEWPDRDGLYLTVRENVVSFNYAQFPISNIKIWVNAGNMKAGGRIMLWGAK